MGDGVIMLLQSQWGCRVTAETSLNRLIDSGYYYEHSENTPCVLIFNKREMMQASKYTL